MKLRFLALILSAFLLSAGFTLMSAAPQSGYKPYVYTPTVPETAFSVLALYKMGDYGRVLEGCEWLLQIKTPFDSWGRAYGEEHEAKYTGMALMALIRGESIARGRYSETINGAAYWLIFKQNSDGSWEDYLGTAIAVIALKEFERSRYVDPNLPNFREQVRKAIARGVSWLESYEPQSDLEKIFGYMALGNKDKLDSLPYSPYKYFAQAYLGEEPNIPENETPKGPLEMALFLYATGSETYHKKLLEMEHFGFWGTLRYNPVELMGASYVKGFEDLREVSCPYLGRIKEQLSTDWEKVLYGKYFMSCGLPVELPNESSYHSLQPWQIAEIARLKAEMGKPYDVEVSYLLSHSNGSYWLNFYNTEYVVWVLKGLNVSFNYDAPLQYLEENLDNVSPTYYYAYAVLVFSEFHRENALNRTLEILSSRQAPVGGWGYTVGSPVGIKSTAQVLWALQEAGLKGKMYSKGYSYLIKALYVHIPNVKVGDVVSVENSTLVGIMGGRYIGNSTGSINASGLDGVVYIYTAKDPLIIGSIPVNGFRAESPWRGRDYAPYVKLVVIVALLLLGFYAVVLIDRRR